MQEPSSSHSLHPVSKAMPHKISQIGAAAVVAMLLPETPRRQRVRSESCPPPFTDRRADESLEGDSDSGVKVGSSSTPSSEEGIGSSRVMTLGSSAVLTNMDKPESPASTDGDVESHQNSAHHIPLFSPVSGDHTPLFSPVSGDPNYLFFLAKHHQTIQAQLLDNQTTRLSQQTHLLALHQYGHTLHNHLILLANHYRSLGEAYHNFPLQVQHSRLCHPKLRSFAQKHFTLAGSRLEVPLIARLNHMLISLRRAEEANDRGYGAVSTVEAMAWVEETQKHIDAVSGVFFKCQEAFVRLRSAVEILGWVKGSILAELSGRQDVRRTLIGESKGSVGRRRMLRWRWMQALPDVCFVWI